VGGAVGIGVVGAGAVAVRGILPHLAQADRVRLAAVCDPVPGRARSAAERFGVAHGYERYEDLLADDAVDAVTIASPIALHHEQGLQALEAGKHVHFNKPMALTAVEATELIDLAAARDLRIVASPGEMLRPHNAEIRRLIEAGAIGTVCWAICGAAFGTYHEDEPERRAADLDPSWYFRRPGGGPLYDMTVYALHALTGILGPVHRVTALSGVRIPERVVGSRTVETEADDNTVMLLDFGDNLFAVAYGTAAGKVLDDPPHGVTYFGTRGTIDGLMLNGEPLDFPGRGVDLQWLLPHVSGVHREILEQHVFEDIMQLVDWIADGTPSIVTAEHARHVIEIIEAAYRAAATGETQRLETAF
jgi:predicted dehydrogenase